MNDEQVIWQHFITGSIQAFEQLMQSNFSLLMNYGQKFCPDKELVKDCIQDLFLNLWSKRENLSHSVQVRAYLFSSLRRALLRKLSANGHANLSLERPLPEFYLELSIEEKLITRETSRRIARKIADSLKELPARQKEVIYLKFFQEMDRSEIAASMGISAQTVSNLLQLALKKLKENLGASPGENLLLFLLPLLANEIIF